MAGILTMAARGKEFFVPTHTIRSGFHSFCGSVS